LGTDNLEFIGIYNPGTSRVEIGGYQFVKGITFTFPEGVTIGSKETFYVASNAASSFWDGRGAVVFQWESGRLADEGEAIQLINQSEMIVDQVKYNNKTPWPILVDINHAISLNSFDVDNHFGENWKLLSLSEIVSAKSLSNNISLSVYPNPSTGLFTISGLKSDLRNYEVFNLQGKLVKTGIVTSGKTTIDLSGEENGMYLIRSGSDFGKMLLMK